MTISSKLQDQIYFLCSKIPNLEWSGVLFYKCEGTFGEDDFKVHCHELFPLDIGVSTYTEYDTGDPEFIKFMMANPQILEMKKGHIHSHNNMATWFSGVDDGELQDNSPNHNIYVSLIVNNRNVNCAKIAFLTTEVEATLEFNDPDGNKKQRKVKRDTQVILAYECDIIYPESVSEVTLNERFQQLHNAVKDKRGNTTARDTHSTHGVVRTYPQHERPEWNQPKLPYAPSGQALDAGSKEGPSNSRVGVQRPANSRALIIPEGVTGKNLLKSINNQDFLTDKLNKGRTANLEVYSFASKLIALDMVTEEPIEVILRRLNYSFYPVGIRSVAVRTEAASHYDSIVRRSEEFYYNSWPDDTHMLMFDDTIKQVMEIVGIFDAVYPELTESLSEALTMAVDPIGGNQSAN